MFIKGWIYCLNDLKSENLRSKNHGGVYFENLLVIQKRT